MKIQEFLEHHGIARNPFAEEDAQTDPVFKDHCIASTYHPTWDKVYGDPSEPATSIVFGEKGSGKTAMRLQLARHLCEFNRSRASGRVFVIHYDDFNPYLDRFRDRLSRRRRRPEKALAEWRLWDHMDAILAIGTTGLIDRFVPVRHPSPHVDCELSESDIDRLDRHQSRDLLLLAACYDESTAETFRGRWKRLRQRLRFRTWRVWTDCAIGSGASIALVALMIGLATSERASWLGSMWFWLFFLGALAAGWGRWLFRAASCWWLSRGITHNVRVGNRETGPLWHVLMQFTRSELSAQPLPNKERTDDRYELLCKLQGILQTLGYSGILVLVDRIDEPHLINGSADLMKALLWPMLDNKFLKHPGLGLKMMVPSELTRFIDREDREFYQRARLDKQNMIPSFEWTGESLYDVMNARIRACAADGSTPTVRALFSPALTDRRLIDALRSLRVPRHLFKFMYHLLVKHCHTHTDQAPVWEVSAETFESSLALYLRELDAFDRGMGAG